MKALTPVLVVLATSIAPAVPAQNVSSLTGEDSAGIHVSVLRALFDHLNVDTTSITRLWIVTGEAARFGPGGVGQVILNEREQAAIRTAFTVTRTAVAMEPLFQCPLGVRVRMPGRGCPIRDDGIIVRFMPILVDGDTLRTGGEAIQRAPGRSGTMTWAKGVRVIYVREGEIWVFRSAGIYWET